MSDAADVSRVMMIGGAGSGKSTLARWMGAQMGLSVHHLDQVFWMPNWTQRPEEDKLRIVGVLEAQDEWILEGNVSATFENRIARADMLVWLDLPVTLRLWRVLRRTLRYRGKTRPELPAGCIQRFDMNTASFLRFIWQDRHKGPARMAACRAKAGEGVLVHHLTSRSEVRAFQATLTGHQRS